MVPRRTYDSRCGVAITKPSSCQGGTTFPAQPPDVTLGPERRVRRRRSQHTTRARSHLRVVSKSWSWSLLAPSSIAPSLRRLWHLWHPSGWLAHAWVPWLCWWLAFLVTHRQFYAWHEAVRRALGLSVTAHQKSVFLLSRLGKVDRQVSNLIVGSS